MYQRRREINEKPAEYYYKMLAIGRRGELSDQAIIKYVIKSINNEDMKRHISKNYANCHELLVDIITYCQYSKIRTTPTINSSVARKTPPSFAPKTPHTPAPTTEIHENIPKVRVPMCYNCFKPVHKSIKCPEPQRRKRCNICNRTTHATDNCPEPNRQNAEVNLINNRSGTRGEITKTVSVNARSTTAFDCRHWN